MNQNNALTLTLGPILFNWKPEKWRDFYFHIADEAPVDTVVLGEIVCSKREPFLAPFIPEVLERLEAAGKEVILASPILVMKRRERNAIKDLAEAGYKIEANDTTALHTMTGHRFDVGPFINVYNEASRVFFENAGTERISLNGELSLASIEAIAKGAAVPIEVFAFGRMPLAISARCYHARSYDLAKDSCQYVCANHTDGMDVDTMSGEPFLCVNGVQTLSHTVHCAIGDVEALKSAGVSALRLSPQDCDMAAVATLFRQTIDGDIPEHDALVQLDDLINGLPFSNGFLHGREGFRARGSLANFSHI